jgi:nicotinate-nucleotide adenylyltransferase
MSVVGLYGGSFDPPHVGHLLLGDYVLATGEIEGLLLVPAHRHAFGKGVAPFHERVAMTRLLATAIGPEAEVSEIEAELPSPSRTLATLQELSKRRPDDEFRLVVGEDVLSERHDWHGWDQILEIAPLLVVGRHWAEAPVGVRRPEIKLPMVSSTEIRARLAAGDDASALVPTTILRHIREKGLYGVPEWL